MVRKYPEKNYGERTEERLAKMKAVLAKRQPDLTVVAENIYDPHNFSAALRSCDAVGVTEVSLVYDGSQPFPKLGKKSSASAKKWMRRHKFDSIDKCYETLRERKMKIYSTGLNKETKSLYELDLTEPVALVFGNEREGLSKRAVEAADENFRVPQVGMIESLNISVACAVSLYEAFRQRAEKGFYDSARLPELDFNSILEEWLKV